MTNRPAWESLPKTGPCGPAHRARRGTLRRARHCRALTGALGGCVLPAVLAASAAASGAPEGARASFPGYPETRVILTLKAKADRLYAAGRYTRSHRFYARRLAFYGDKYSQYMAGFQYLHGQGVPRDLPRALAWYRLAAERGEPAFERARDDLARRLSPAEQRAAHDHFQDIAALYGDQRILERLIFADLRELRSMTGSRIGATVAPLTILNGDGSISDATRYYDAVEQRLQARVATLEMLRGRVDYGELTVLEPLDVAEQRAADDTATTGSEPPTP